MTISRRTPPTQALPAPAAATPTISSAAAAIRPFIRRTPTLMLEASGRLSTDVCLKLELLQHSGSFKVRGAFANMLLRDVPPGGVVAASGGNHGSAVAFAARALGVRATIFVPEIAAAAKIERILSYGAELHVVRGTYSDALAESESWAQGRSVLAIHAFDQPETIAGQGTLGMEIESQEPGATVVVVPVGGGGLLSGLVMWYGRRLAIVPVEPAACPTLSRALEAGHPVDAQVGGLAADSLGPRRVGERVFGIVQHMTGKPVLVTEDEIAAAQRHLWDAARLVVEPGGAAAFAAVLSGAYQRGPEDRVVVLLTGGNTSAVRFESGGQPETKR